MTSERAKETETTAERRARFREVLGPRGVIANALQVMRIPGQEVCLGNVYDNQIIGVWADALISALAMYDYEIAPKRNADAA